MAPADAFARVDLSRLAGLEVLDAGTEGARRPLDLGEWGLETSYDAE
jgi:hypothetical protein